jgi:hypothetical protein
LLIVRAVILDKGPGRVLGHFCRCSWGRCIALKFQDAITQRAVSYTRKNLVLLSHTAAKTSKLNHYPIFERRLLWDMPRKWPCIIGFSLFPGLFRGAFLVSMTCGGRLHERGQDYFRFQPATLSCYFSFIAFMLRSFINVSLSTELFILQPGCLFSPFL